MGVAVGDVWDAGGFPRGVVDVEEGVCVGCGKAGGVEKSP